MAYWKSYNILSEICRQYYKSEKAETFKLYNYLPHVSRAYAALLLSETE